MAPCTTVPEYAAAIATDIRTNGHFRGEDPPHNKTDKPTACVVANNISAETSVIQSFRESFAAIVGVHYDPNGWTISNLTNWNDDHSTDEVLAVLDQIANGKA